MGRERNLVYDHRITDYTPTTHIKGTVNREGIRKMTPREMGKVARLSRQICNSCCRRIRLQTIRQLRCRACNSGDSKENFRINFREMNKLNQLGITVGKDNKAEVVFDSLFPSFMTVKYKKPSDYITTYWEAFQKHPEGNNNLNGKIFEYILATLFVREGLLPLYLSAKVAFVPNVIYDLMFYTTERGPICISAKTSLA